MRLVVRRRVLAVVLEPEEQPTFRLSDLDFLSARGAPRKPSHGRGWYQRTVRTTYVTRPRVVTRLEIGAANHYDPRHCEVTENESAAFGARRRGGANMAQPKIKKALNRLVGKGPGHPTPRQCVHYKGGVPRGARFDR